jgi:HSP20 family molecular chaperone IbpA
MASQTVATKTKETSSPVEVQKLQAVGNRANDAVARRAYSLYLASGGADGQDVAHWLQAESEVLTRVPDIRESSSWYTVNVPLQGFRPEQVQVGVDENRAIISADKTQTNNQSGRDGSTTSESIFLMADWPSAVDPSTASAYVKGDTLTLTVKRAEGAKASA